MMAAGESEQTYFDWLRARYPQQIDPEGRLNDYLAVRDNRLHFRDRDLLALARQHGTPLELVYTPTPPRRMWRRR
jgi:hypothetical protein